MEEQKKAVSTWVVILVVVVILGGLLAFLLSNKTEGDNDGFKSPVASTPNNQGSVPTNTAKPAPKSPPTSGTTASGYKNGTFSAIGGYDSPAGWDTMSVSLTLSNGVVTNVVVAPDAVASGSQRWVQRFISGVNQVVVGVKLDDLNLTQVSGASLTPQGFNDAVAKIKAQAKA